jgi:hypothetical protein
MDAVEAATGKQVFALLTDGAANMVHAWALLKAKRPALLTLRCCANSANLLLEDCIHKTPAHEVFDVVPLS